MVAYNHNHGRDKERNQQRTGYLRESFALDADTPTFQLDNDLHSTENQQSFRDQRRPRIQSFPRQADPQRHPRQQFP